MVVGGWCVEVFECVFDEVVCVGWYVLVVWIDE